MYESLTFEVLLKRMLDRVSNSLDKREGSIIYDAAAPAANELQNAYINLDIMIKAFEIAGYTEEDLKQKFGALYNAFQFGAPPHAGMAPGVDRMIMLLRNEENIREIMPFPMNGNAQDLMCGARGEVTETQLREVHIKVRQ